MSVFDEAVIDLFADDNFACDALYKAGGLGSGVTVRLIFWDVEETEPFVISGAIVRNASADVQLSEVATPALGDTYAFTLRGVDVVYRVKANPRIDRSAGTARLAFQFVS